MNVSSHQYVWPGWHVKVLACRSDMQHVHTCCEPCACLRMIGLCTIVSPMLIWLTFFLQWSHYTYKTHHALCYLHSWFYGHSHVGRLKGFQCTCVATVLISL
jgi:hypothetical protein